MSAMVRGRVIMRTPRAPAKTLLIVSGAREAMPIIAAARRMGLRVLRIGVPWCAPVERPAALEALAARTQLQLALRPVDGGVALRLLPDVDLRWALEVAAAASPSGSVMVEEQVAGARVRAEAIVV